MRKAGTTGYYAAKVRNIIEISKKNQARVGGLFAHELDEIRTTAKDYKKTWYLQQ